MVFTVAPSFSTELLDHHEIMYALVPGTDDPGSNDPRFLVIKRACHVVRALTSDLDGSSIYMCN